MNIGKTKRVIIIEPIEEPARIEEPSFPEPVSVPIPAKDPVSA